MCFSLVPGKALMSTRVVRKSDGEAPGWGRGLVRTLASLLSAVYGLGYLWALWDGALQTWHDTLAGTMVQG
ncbi:MAG: hypothetical protein C4290_01840 [Chloroflexota bacterium]